MSIRNTDVPSLASKRDVSARTVLPWARPANWLPLPSVVGLQKFVGLHAVFPDSNFIALSAEGNFTVDWGDGTAAINTASGVTAEYNIPYANAAPTSDVGIASAVACTFTDAGDTVNLTAHGWQNGQTVAFSLIASTTGISTYTTYYVVNRAANTFQVAATAGGTPLTLTTNGSGSVYIPQYRQVIVTVVPNGGNLTKLNLHIKNSTAGLQSYSSGFLDVAISAASMTDLRFGVQTPGSSTQTITHSMVQQFSLIVSDLRQLGYLFYFCVALVNVQNFVTSSTAAASASCTFTDSTDTVGWVSNGFRDGDSVVFTAINSTIGITPGIAYFVRDVTPNTFKISNNYNGTALALTTNGTGTAVRGTNFSFAFAACSVLSLVAQFDTAAGTNFTSMFSGCYSLRSVPLFNTAAGVIFNAMFYSCYSLVSVPLFNTAAGISLVSMFYGCSILSSVPLFNTILNADFSSMFSGCYALSSVPLFNTAAGTNFSSMFNACSSLITVPLFNTAAGTNFSSMFNTCSSLLSVPLFNTAAGTTFSNMFYNCFSLLSVPLFNTSLATNLSTMFYGCRSLVSVPLFNTASNLNFSSMFEICASLSFVPSFNTAAGTNFGFMFWNCFSLKSAAFQGTANTISYASCELSAAELNKIYTGLATVSAKTITVTGNWGTAADNPAIATGKGWTVTG